jgi:hypothetical protein
MCNPAQITQEEYRTMKTSVLKPGFLVSLKTSLQGGVTYKRIDTNPEHTTEDGAIVATWETTREIPDPEEFERATAARGKARFCVASACCNSAFGLLCPISDEDKLQQAITDARTIADEHNRNNFKTHVDVFVMVGRVAENDAEAARAISYEVRELLDTMKAGIAAADPAAIREAANKARNLGAMLSPDVAGQISAAIIQAREAARAIVKRVQKAGETAAAVVAECQTAKIDAARFSFLDMDENGAPVETVSPAARGIDMPAADDDDQQQQTSAPAPKIEMDTPTSVTQSAYSANARSLELF